VGCGVLVTEDQLRELGLLSGGGHQKVTWPSPKPKGRPKGREIKEDFDENGEPKF